MTVPCRHPLLGGPRVRSREFAYDLGTTGVDSVCRILGEDIDTIKHAWPMRTFRRRRRLISCLDRVSSVRFRCALGT
jgi:hypothetical protein